VETLEEMSALRCVLSKFPVPCLSKVPKASSLVRELPYSDGIRVWIFGEFCDEGWQGFDMLGM
jgi:hypothetical protein